MVVQTYHVKVNVLFEAVKIHGFTTIAWNAYLLSIGWTLNPHIPNIGQARSNLVTSQLVVRQTIRVSPAVVLADRGCFCKVFSIFIGTQ